MSAPSTPRPDNSLGLSKIGLYTILCTTKRAFDREGGLGGILYQKKTR